nr:RNA-guided endonuclease TnpB family protein [Xenococcaceae cyanobacterium MO_167.B27]
SYWSLLGSQATQDVIERIDRSYQQFFKYCKTKKIGTPRFKSYIKYKSFTLKQAGYKFLGGNKLKIGKKIYKYSKSREILGKVKTITIKRDGLGDIYIFVVTDFVDEQVYPLSGNSVGIDFGLKDYLITSDGNKYKSPEFFKQYLDKIQKLSKLLSSKKKGYNNRKKAKNNLIRRAKKIKNLREDYQWKLARDLLKEYDNLYFEDLSLKGMVKLWGRKISDLSHSEFLKKLEYLANKLGKFVGKIDRFYPSSKTCSICLNKVDSLPLTVREWCCLRCKTVHDRDKNAAQNILRVGASTYKGESVRLLVNKSNS